MHFAMCFFYNIFSFFPKKSNKKIPARLPIKAGFFHQNFITGLKGDKDL